MKMEDQAGMFPDNMPELSPEDVDRVVNHAHCCVLEAIVTLASIEDELHLDASASVRRWLAVGAQDTLRLKLTKKKL